MKWTLIIAISLLLFACNNGGNKGTNYSDTASHENAADSQRSAVHQQSSADFPQPVIETDSVNRDSLEKVKKDSARKRR